MLFCPRCGNKMNKIMHFEKDNNCQFNQCSNKKCNFTTKKKKIVLNIFK